MEDLAKGKEKLRERRGRENRRYGGMKEKGWGDDAKNEKRWRFMAIWKNQRKKKGWKTLKKKENLFELG